MRRKSNFSRRSNPRYSSKIPDSMVIYSSSAAISVVPTKKFCEWVCSLPGKEEFNVLEHECRCYLISDRDGHEDCDDWVMENAQQIFEEECREYDAKGRNWPTIRNLETLWEYFNFIYHTRVIHLARTNVLN